MVRVLLLAAAVVVVVKHCCDSWVNFSGSVCIFLWHSGGGLQILLLYVFFSLSKKVSCRKFPCWDFLDCQFGLSVHYY